MGAGDGAGVDFAAPLFAVRSTTGFSEADGETIARARRLGLDPMDYFRRSDSYSFFEALGDSLIVGPTGNNLRDVRILVAK